MSNKNLIEGNISIKNKYRVRMKGEGEKREGEKGGGGIGRLFYYYYFFFCVPFFFFFFWPLKVELIMVGHYCG